MNDIVNIYTLIKNKKELPFEDLLKIGITKPNIEVIVSLNVVDVVVPNTIRVKDEETFLSALIILGKYQDALDYLDVLYYFVNDDEKKAKYNYYYYLLSYTCPLSEKQMELVSSLTYEDMTIKNKSNRLLGPYNGIRRKAFKGRFREAKAKLENTVKYQKRTYDISDIVEEKLLSEVVYLDEEKYKALYAFLMEQDYDYMYDYLNRIKKTRCLTIYEDAILTLVGDYIELLNGNNLENTENKGDNLIEAIKYKNYRFADFICKNCEEYKNHKDEIGIISILLNDIIIYIDKNKNTLKRIN